MSLNDWAEYGSFCDIPFHRSGVTRITQIIEHYTNMGAIITKIWWKQMDTSGNDTCPIHCDAAYHYELKIEGIRKRNKDASNNVLSKLKGFVSRDSNTVPFVDRWVDSGYVCSHKNGLYYLVSSQ